MKLAGRKISGPNVETIVFPRGDGDPIVLKAQAILDYEPFDQLCPKPKPPTIMKKGGVRESNPEDPRYRDALHEWGRKRLCWIVLTSLRLGTPELEWETVDYGDPNTWTNFEDELKESGFSEIEVGRINRGVMIANALDDDKLDEARNAFLASVAAEAASLSSQADELNSTLSGEPVSDSE